jgi:CheY-like chemotaxis protein/ketosteroid isomerase-like protein
MGSPTTEQARLLIVEDDHDIRETIAMVLDEEGYTASFAVSLEDGLALVDAVAFQLILTDLFATSGQDPLASVEALRLRAAPTPVGIMTSWKVPPEEAERRGFRFLLHKPFGLEEFLTQVAAALKVTLSAEQRRQEAIVRRYFAALTARDWDALATLCADDVAYSLPGASSFAAETFAHFPDARFGDVLVYASPKGLAARYQGSWAAPDGSAQRQSGATIFRFEGTHIAQIGVLLNEAYLQARLGGAPDTPPAS